MLQSEVLSLGGGRPHAFRVAYIARDIALACGFPLQAADEIAYAGAFHDIGKSAVPKGILNKNGPLTPSERAIIQKHPAFGAKMLPPELTAAHPTLLQTVLCHHERWDGSGYPNGLWGFNIPFQAHIVGAADCVEALGARRPYKAGLPLDTVLEMVTHNQCGPFDKIIYGYLSSEKARAFLEFVFRTEDVESLDKELVKLVDADCRSLSWGGAD